MKPNRKSSLSELAEARKAFSSAEPDSEKKPMTACSSFDKNFSASSNEGSSVEVAGRGGWSVGDLWRTCACVCMYTVHVCVHVCVLPEDTLTFVARTGLLLHVGHNAI